jgi:hypothetical protein
MALHAAMTQRRYEQFDTFDAFKKDFGDTGGRVAGQRHFFLFDQEQLIKPNMRGTELIGWFAEVLSELTYGVKIDPNGGRRIVPDLEILQPPLSGCGHDENSFRCDDNTKTRLVENRPSTYMRFTCRRLIQCVITGSLRCYRQTRTEEDLLQSDGGSRQRPGTPYRQARSSYR